MLARGDITTILQECGKVAKNGLGNGKRGHIQPLLIDFVSPPKDFIGVGANPAIYVNKATFNLLGNKHKNWKVDNTIAVQETFLCQNPLRVIGIIAHEVGHAFNVAIQISNTETNAYIFEIEVMKYLVASRHPLIAHYSKEEVRYYFESRLSNYERDPDSYLAKLIQEIKQGVILENLNNTSNASNVKINSDSRYLLGVSSTLFARKNEDGDNFIKSNSVITVRSVNRQNPGGGVGR